MAVKISQLTTSSAVTSNDFVPIVDFETTTTKRASASQILDYITGSNISKLQITSLTGSFISGTSAQFTVVTASNISSSVGRFAQITSSNILINDASGNKIFAGTNGSSLTSPAYSFLPAESSTGITSISTNTVDILNNGTVNLSVSALGIVDVDKNIDYTTINNTSVISPQTFDAASAHIARWSASWTGNITANISNLANGRTFILYARNTNSIARTITIQASATTTGHIAVDCSRSGAASVTLISLAANTGTTTIWVSNVAGTFIGAIF